MRCNEKRQDRECVGRGRLPDEVPFAETWTRRKGRPGQEQWRGAAGREDQGTDSRGTVPGVMVGKESLQLLSSNSGLIM